MGCVIGVQYKEFVIMASDMTCAPAFIVMNQDTPDNIISLGSNAAMTGLGKLADRTHIGENVKGIVQLHKIRHGYDLSLSQILEIIKDSVSGACKLNENFRLDVLLAGYDDLNGFQLYYADTMYGSLRVPYICTGGMAGPIGQAMIQEYYCEKCLPDAAYILLRTCLQQMHPYFLTNLANFRVVIVDSDGVRNLPDITLEVALQVDMLANLTRKFNNKNKKNTKVNIIKNKQQENVENLTDSQEGNAEDKNK